MKPILEIEHISKKFTINHEQQPYLSLRDSLSNIFKQKKTTEDFWALDDVSFNVEQGDTVGIIGKNGAGKSTLLKILSKITPPTSGKITSRGRIASLLEVGTGFHPELSGRENIFMNGSILGMRKAEILKNFDAIVDFAGVEKFIDTPLKHYSSGMQLRLAFAVAAFLENEILIIDEVLAVGDMEFQKKCMGKMEDVSKSGRTILFVSHQLGTVSNLCSKGILLNKGKLINAGKTEHVISEYLKLGNLEKNKFSREKSITDKREYFINEISTCSYDFIEKGEFLFNESIFINLKLHVAEQIPSTCISISLQDKMDNIVFTICEDATVFKVENKQLNLQVKLPASLIAPNSYSFRVGVFIPNHRVIDLIESVCHISIIDSGTAMAKFEGINYGNVIVNSEWKVINK